MEATTSSDPTPLATTNTAAAPPNIRHASDDEEDIIDPKQYRENRLKYIVANMSQGNEPYPHKFSVSMTILQYIDTYQRLSNGDHLEDVSVSLAGRVKAIRTSGAKLVFYDLYDDDDFKVQIMADARSSDLDVDEFKKLHSSVKRFDIVGVTGFPGKSRTGELSIFPKTLVVLSHCLHMMPKQESAAANNANLMGNQWVPGSARSPEKYILKDQVLLVLNVLG